MRLLCAVMVLLILGESIFLFDELPTRTSYIVQTAATANAISGASDMPRLADASIGGTPSRPVYKSDKIDSRRSIESIGLIGLGRMGRCDGRPAAGGWLPLAVYNRTRAKAEELLASGASWAETPAELASRADITLTILTDDRAVEQIYQGEQGLVAGAIEGKLFIEMSTIRTSTITDRRADHAARRAPARRACVGHGRASAPGPAADDGGGRRGGSGAGATGAEEASAARSCMWGRAAPGRP